MLLIRCLIRILKNPGLQSRGGRFGNCKTGCTPADSPLEKNFETVKLDALPVDSLLDVGLEQVKPAALPANIPLEVGLETI